MAACHGPSCWRCAAAAPSCGVAGVRLSMAQGNGFLRDMSAGRGYPALAALIFGKWRPWPVLRACLLFAAAAVLTRLQGATLLGIGAVPVQLIQALPIF